MSFWVLSHVEFCKNHNFIIHGSWGWNVSCVSTMKAAVLLALVLALTWAPRSPTRGLRGFLEGLGLEALCKKFVREEMREMNEQQFLKDLYWSDGPEHNSCLSSCSTSRWNLENEDNHLHPATADEVQTAAIAGTEAEPESEAAESWAEGAAGPKKPCQV